MFILFSGNSFNLCKIFFITFVFTLFNTKQRPKLADNDERARMSVSGET